MTSIPNPKSMNFNKRSNHLKDGAFRVKIQKAELRNVTGGRAYIIEFVVVESGNPASPVGTVASHYIGFNKYPDSSYRDSYLFLAAAFGHAGDVPWIQENISDGAFVRLTCEGNVIGTLGLEMSITTNTHPQKLDPSKDFTDHNWGSAINPQPLEHVLRMPLGTVAPQQSALPLPPPPPSATFPPAGWLAHPSAPGYFYKGQDVLSEAQLRALR